MKLILMRLEKNKLKDIKTLEKEIKNNLEKIKDKDNLNQMFEIISPLRKKMDKYDAFLVNFKDGLKRVGIFLFGNKIKNKIINDLFDLVEGFENYSEEDKKYTLQKLEEIAKIHDRTLWEKIISVLRAS